MRSVLAVIVAIMIAAPAYADPDAIALLPLDAEQRLEIYGQPVASELARALGAGGIEVVVVGPKMAVPERARIVIDGTIKAGKGDAVALAIRLRDKSTGKVLDTLDVDAPELTAIDRAAEKLSALVLPAVKKQLTAMHEAKQASPTEVKPPEPNAPPAPILVAVTGGKDLRDALEAQLDKWIAAHHRTANAVDAAKLAPKIAVKSIAAASAELGIAAEIVGYSAEPGAVPMARARVHVRITDHANVIWDRTVVTDTVVGDRAMKPAALAARVAESVIAIIDPHARRAHATW